MCSHNSSVLGLGQSSSLETTPMPSILSRARRLSALSRLPHSSEPMRSVSRSRCVTCLLSHLFCSLNTCPMQTASLTRCAQNQRVIGRLTNAVESSSSAPSSYYYLYLPSPTRKTPLRQVGSFHWFCSSLSLALAWHSECRQACHPYRYLVPFNSSSVGSAVNPARDLGPRIMTAMVGYGRKGTANPICLVAVPNSFLLQSSIIVVSTGSGPLFWAPFVADFLPPSSMRSSSTAVRTVLSIPRE